MPLKQITLASLIFSIGFFNNTIAMNQENRFTPNYFKVYSNADLAKRFPIKNKIFGYPQPDFENYRAGAIDPDLYNEVVSATLSLNSAILEPNPNVDRQNILNEWKSRDFIEDHMQRQAHIEEVNHIKNLNIEYLSVLNACEDLN